MNFLEILDRSLHFLHFAVLAFNIFGWIFPQTRRAHLLVASVTAFSWLGLGAWFGWGYCFLTDWQWRIKELLQQPPPPPSYISYLIEQWFGFTPSNDAIFVITGGGFAVIFALSLWLNLRTGFQTRSKE